MNRTDPEQIEDQECQDCGETYGLIGPICERCAAERNERARAAGDRAAVAAELKAALDKAEGFAHLPGDRAYRHAYALGYLQQSVRQAIAKLEAA